MRRGSYSRWLLDKRQPRWRARLDFRKRWPATVLFVFVCVNFTVLWRIAAAEGIYLNAQNGSIPATYFGMHIHVHDAPVGGAWPSIPFGAWRLSDTYVSWFDLEPRKGEWRFERLDKYVEFVGRRGVEVVLPFVLSPPWASARPDEPSAYHKPGLAAEPRDLADWRRYVGKVAGRYKGKIRFYEIWNEPNTPGLYSGSVDQLVELTRVAREELKAVDPAALLVSPSFVAEDGLKKLDEFLAKGGGRHVDIVGYHFYVAPEKPEYMLGLIREVRRLMGKHGVAGKPLWNTETGWLIANSRGAVDPKHVGFPADTKILSSDEAPAYVARALILSWAAGVQRLYWYAWDNKALGLSEEEGKVLKPAARAYSRTYRWLRDARMNSCRGDSRGIWTCQLIRPGEDRAWLVWTTAKQSRWVPPPDWRVVEREDLGGRVTRIDAVKQGLLIGSAPALFRPGPMQRVSLP